ncbi:oncoprotein-induced transcript 3 protein-like [Mercenaria mercenaria]|uniref:oncoprotein-induced transcript 3 protein-like n=1 Tax=Mercenaria mercenaria TaxID=6596 RepID=UPI001E1DCE89|nr:oncoprotein-induced transcript 3 protein-like [Mercenaria mercenaria]XP_045176081.1 oncoprotein-induced transcript 3 protein-like [Mercenaria mercenaria]
MVENKYKMMFWMQWSFIFLIQFYLHVDGTTDPCTSHTTINDTTLTVAYKASSVDNIICQASTTVSWYRYTGTTNGRMTNKCPQDLQCGSKNQIWFNDTIPTLTDGEVLRQICTHEGSACCALSIDIKTKNCTDFIVYHLVSAKNCTNYCFEAPKSGGGNSGLKNDKGGGNSGLKNDKGGGNIGSKNDAASILVWIMIAVVVLL